MLIQLLQCPCVLALCIETVLCCAKSLTGQPLYIAEALCQGWTNYPSVSIISLVCGLWVLEKHSHSESVRKVLSVTSLWYAASSTGAISEEGGLLARHITSHAATFQAASVKPTAESHACQMP